MLCGQAARSARAALTITLPPEIGDRQLLIAMAFGVVMFSLLVQGVSLSLVVRRAGLAGIAAAPPLQGDSR